MQQKSQQVEKKFIIDTSTLRPGDILLSTTDAPISKLIRFSTQSEHSHAMICINSHCIIHADSDGVHSFNPQRQLFDQIDYCMIYRLKRELSTDELQKIEYFARSKIGSAYSRKEAFQSLSQKDKPKSRRYFCSRLVAEAYNAANISIASNPSYCTPEDIRAYGELTPITNPLRTPSGEEMRIITDKINLQEIQTVSTNYILDHCRAIFSSDIQTLEDVYKCVVQEPDKDQTVFQIIQTSGYLDLWEQEHISNYPLYDWEFMKANISHEGIGKITNDIGDTEKEFLRLVAQLNEFEKLYRKHQFKCFEQCIELYSNLSRMAYTRHKTIESAKQYLLGV